MADIFANLIQAQAAAVADEQVHDIQQSLQGLLREHLRSMLDANKLPPSNEPVNLETCRLMAGITSAALQQDGDVLAAELLQAALRLSQGSAEKDAEHIRTYANEFLKRAYGVLRSEGAAAGFRTCLEETLVELSGRRWFNFELPPSMSPSTAAPSLPAGPEHCITLYTKDGSISSLGFYDILPTFWETRPGTRLDTHCHHCEQPIVDEPPIRTVARVEPGPTATSTHVRVTNRHFSCLKASGVLWVPVSHVWHDSIRRANELRTHNDEAASALLSTLSALLDASVDAYGPNVEFWHDYFSVPQWEEKTKEALLLRIPALYHGAQEILVHMADFPGSYIMTVLPFSSAEFSAATALRLMPVLHGLCTSQWMQRMWVLLEYALCRGACVMDQSGYVWRDPGQDASGRMDRDTFTTFVQNCHTILLGLFRHACSFAKSLKDGFLAGLTDKEDAAQQSSLCLGEALELIARTQCQVFRDRFLAVHMLVNKNSPPRSPAIPLDATEACRWVWEAALRGGDFSPLLLQPRECHGEANPPAGMPSWMTGYSSLDHAEWDLGNLMGKPLSAIGLGNGAVTTELDVLGKIQRIHYLDVEKSGEVAGVEWAIGLLGSLTSTRRLSASELIAGLNRIFPFDIVHTKYAQHQAGVVYTLDGRQAQDRRFVVKVDRCLAEYFAAPPGTSQRRYAAQKITQLLKYDSHIMGSMAKDVTRLTRSRHIARSRHQRGAVNGEPICEVQCLEADCRAVTVVRLDLRASAKIGDKVYRVPGLSYSNTAESGVGLVLNKDGRITGRMLWGSPGCCCQSRQRVDIR